MAQADTIYLTEDAYFESRTNQDRLLRNEFGKVRSELNEFRDESRVEFNVMRSEFASASVDLSGVKRELNGVKKDVGSLLGLKDEVGSLREEVNGVKEEVNGVKERLGRVEESVDELRVNLLRTTRQLYNGRLRKPYLRLEPIPVYQPGTGTVIPTEFPKNAYEFWNLKSPNKVKLTLLMYLVQFYDLQDYHNWGQTDSRMDSDISTSGTGTDSDRELSDSERILTREDAVRKYPEAAVESLAALFGLDEDNFHSFQARAAELRERPKQPASKRRATSEVATAKRIKKQLPATSPAVQTQIPIQLEDLLASPKSKSKTSSHGLDNAPIWYGSSSTTRRIRQDMANRVQEARRQEETAQQCPESPIDILERSSQLLYPGSPTEVIERSPPQKTHSTHSAPKEDLSFRSRSAKTRRKRTTSSCTSSQPPLQVQQEGSVTSVT